MAKNAEYSYKKMTDAEKIVFEQSIKDDRNKLLRISTKQNKDTNDQETGDTEVSSEYEKNKAKNKLFEDEFKYHSIDENRLEELANIYSEIKEENFKLSEKIRTLAWLMVIESGSYFVKQSNVIEMHKKYPYDCSLDEMWCVFTKCFESFDKDYISSNKKSNDKYAQNHNKNEFNNRFIAYFKSSLYNRFLNIYNRNEDKIVLNYDNDNNKVYGKTISIDQEFNNDEGDSALIQIESPTDHISAYDSIDAKVYLFSNLITNIMEHLGTDKRTANDAIKRMFKAFYTGDTIFFAKCYGLDTFYQSMCRSQNKILGSCLNEFFNYILDSDTPQSIKQVKDAEIKTYKQLNSPVFKKKSPNEKPLLYMPTAENNDKRFGFEELVYSAFSKTTGSNITGQIEKYDAFRDKYFFKCKI